MYFGFIRRAKKETVESLKYPGRPNKPAYYTEEESRPSEYGHSRVIPTRFEDAFFSWFVRGAFSESQGSTSVTIHSIRNEEYCMLHSPNTVAIVSRNLYIFRLLQPFKAKKTPGIPIRLIYPSRMREPPSQNIIKIESQNSSWCVVPTITCAW